LDGFLASCVNPPSLLADDFLCPPSELLALRWCETGAVLT